MKVSNVILRPNLTHFKISISPVDQLSTDVLSTLHMKKTEIKKRSDYKSGQKLFED